MRKSYLRRKIYPKDDFSAIGFALSGLSTKKPSERGYDLYTIRKFVRVLKGKMTITTGHASSLIFDDKTEGKKLKKAFKGTKINLETKIKKLDFYKIVK
ncbi:MAG: hypothetical protein QME57_03550 [Patescibacteria group bacterium]|nr:hypothetical protein [Patescibacteria group bacterium]